LLCKFLQHVSSLGSFQRGNIWIFPHVISLRWLNLIYLFEWKLTFSHFVQNVYFLHKCSHKDIFTRPLPTTCPTLKKEHCFEMILTKKKICWNIKKARKYQWFS
jgi:hypothetical protein